MDGCVPISYQNRLHNRDKGLFATLLTQFAKKVPDTFSEGMGCAHGASLRLTSEARAAWPRSPHILLETLMLRSTSLAACALAVTLFVPGSLVQSADTHGSHLMQCAKVCADCQLECDSCFSHCLKLTAEGKKEHQKTAQLCVDCAECCKSCATLCARQSPLAPHMLACCAKCCNDCAAACEKFPDDEHMAKCAKVCRDCAKQCLEMGKKLDK